jgi:hypothetical protein
VYKGSDLLESFQSYLEHNNVVQIAVREDERVLIGRVLCAARARVSRVEVTRRVVARRRGHGRRFSLALPGALGAVRRDEDVLARERVNASVRVCGGVKRLCHRMLRHRRIEGGKGGVHVEMTSIDIRSRASRVKVASLYEADGEWPMSAHARAELARDGLKSGSKRRGRLVLVGRDTCAGVCGYRGEPE